MCPQEQLPNNAAAGVGTNAARAVMVAVHGLSQFWPPGPRVPHDAAVCLEVHVNTGSVEPRRPIQLLAHNPVRRRVDGDGMRGNGPEPALLGAKSKHVPGVRVKPLLQWVGSEHV